MIDMNNNKTCANRSPTGILSIVMNALWLIIPLALIVVSPFLGSRDLRYRDKRGSWRNF